MWDIRGRFVTEIYCIYIFIALNLTMPMSNLPPICNPDSPLPHSYNSRSNLFWTSSSKPPHLEKEKITCRVQKYNSVLQLSISQNIIHFTLLFLYKHFYYFCYAQRWKKVIVWGRLFINEKNIRVLSQTFGWPVQKYKNGASIYIRWLIRKAENATKLQ